MDKKITASMIIEILGRPQEHIKKALEEIVEKIKNIKGVEILESTIHEPKEVELPEELKNNVDAKKVYTSFLDLEAKFEGINELITVALNHMPSNIEISSPSEISIKNSNLSEIISGIMLQLHKYDEVTKKLLAERSLLLNKIRELNPSKVETKVENKVSKEDNKVEAKVEENEVKTEDNSSDEDNKTD